MYRSPNKPIQTNQLKSPQRLASPAVRRVKQKQQALSNNKNIQITESADKDPSQCPKAKVEDKNLLNGKKHSDSLLNGCARDERRSQRVQRREQQKKYAQNQTKIKSQWNKNHESIKKRTSQRKENQGQKTMQKIQKSKDMIRKEESKRISQQYIRLKQQTKDQQNCLYPMSEIKFIAQHDQQQKQKQQVSEVSAQNQSIVNNLHGSNNQHQLYRDRQNGQNIIQQQQLSNQNEQNLLNQLQQACYENYIIKSMPNLPSFNSSQVSTYDKLVNFIKQNLANYQCELHKYNAFNDSQTKRKFDLICLDCDLLLCDYCVLFGNGESNTQGQLNGHQQHKIHKLMKLQQLLQRIKTIQGKYHKISGVLTQMNKKYSSNQNKEVVDEEVVQDSDQINFPMDLNLNSFIKQDKMHKNPEKQNESIQNLISRQKNEKKLQIQQKYHKLLTKLIESKEEAYKNIQKKYSNIKQEANNKIKLNKTKFRTFEERLIQMVNFIGQCLARVNNILEVKSKSLEQDYKQRIQKTVKIIFKSKNSLSMSITETLQRLESELKKYTEQDRQSNQRDQIKTFIQNALKISYNTYIEQNMDTYVTVDTTFHRNFNKLQILNEQSQIQYNTPHKIQHDYNYKSDGFKSIIFQNNQQKIKKEQDPKVGNISIDSEYKQNQFIINFYGPKNSLQRAKSDKNLFKSLQLIPHPASRRKQNINIQIKKLNSPKKQINKQLQRVKSQQKTRQTFMSRPIDKKNNNKKLTEQQIGSLSILSKQNENNNTKIHVEITQKSFLSKSRMISDTEKQLEKQMKIKNIIDEYCSQFEKNQDEVNKKMNKLLDLSYLELNNTELQLILAQIYTKLFKIGNKIALNPAMSSTNIANNPQTKPKLFSFIKLSDNKITTEGFISIVSYLSSASNINISNNMLDFGVLDYIIKNKDKFAPLRIINLKGNFITPFTNANKKQAFLHKKIKEKVSVLGKMGILVHV